VVSSCLASRRPRVQTSALLRERERKREREIRIQTHGEANMRKHRKDSSQRETSKEPNLPTPSPWTFSLQNCEKLLCVV
jgi:hypothetical protein